MDEAEFIGMAELCDEKYGNGSGAMGAAESRRLMMSTQVYGFESRPAVLRWGEPLRIDSGVGEIDVKTGRVWITRRGDLDDHILAAGERMAVLPGDAAVVEAWRQGERATIVWRPARQPRVLGVLPGAAVALGFGGVAAAADFSAAVLRGAASRLSALARSAASIARRAQGCMSAGDSMASAGTVQ